MAVGVLVVFAIIFLAVFFKVMAHKKGVIAPRWIPIQIRVPIPPEEYDRDRVIGSPVSGEGHTVNLHRLVCSCPDQQWRRKYHPGDLRRHCEHLHAELTAQGFTKQMPRMAATVIEGGYTLGDRAEMLQVPSNAEEDRESFVPVFIAVSDDKDWANVFGPDDHDTTGVKEFAFDVEANQWVDGIAPVAGDRIAKYILLSVQ